MKMFKFKSHQSFIKSNSRSAFTIIEVVLVLAIAGLIFLMVFIALPALQRNQRDTQRKNNISLLKDAIERYKANNKGKLPWLYGVAGYQNTNSFGSNYLKWGTEFKDPSGIRLYLSVNEASIARVEGWVHPGYAHYATGQSINFIFLFVGYKCNGITSTPAGQNNYTIIYALEGGGSACTDG